MIEKVYGYKEMDKLKNILDRSLMDSEEVSQQVRDILSRIRSDGDKALLEFTHRFDKNNLSNIRLSEEEFERARRNVDKDLKGALERAIENISRYHEKQRNDGFIVEEEGIILGQIVKPIERVGVYIPGGTASYPSTVLMNVIPANIAGVREIALVTPADKEGKIKDSVILAADLLGVKEIYKIGGAQAIGALAYGTETIGKVDKIVGPGNIYVAMAKHQLSGLVGIDMIAGPSEVVVLASRGANPRFIAADLIAQAEHDTRAASIVVTDSEDLADRVVEELDLQVKELERSEIIQGSLGNYGALIVTENMEEAFQIVNILAPEHLEILTESPMEDYKKVKNAGAIFLGEYSPEAVGDYYAGPNHTLPTLRTSRFSSALGVYDFVKKSSLIYYSKEALMRAGKDIVSIAKNEGLTGHANSIIVRMEGEDV
ncbi:MAG: histidinol dehydrogenase [Tissierellaceae bacterium]